MDHDHDHGHSHGHGHGGGSAIVALGNVQYACGLLYTIDRDGECNSSRVCTFGAEFLRASIVPVVVPSAAWPACHEGKRLGPDCVPSGHDSHWHFDITCNPGSADPSQLFITVGEETKAVQLCAGARPSRGGIITPLYKRPGSAFMMRTKSVPKDSMLRNKLPEPEPRHFCGFAELKLHDDKGDIECFLTDMGEPLDVPSFTVINLSFPNRTDAIPKIVELEPRNEDANEDEDGNPTMNPGPCFGKDGPAYGMTSYFVFPGEREDEDSEWLKGLAWRDVVKLEMEVEEGAAKGTFMYETDPFVLVPHSVLEG